MSAVDLPRKLELTAEALGCGTLKELHVRLLEINPATTFDPERAYKWRQGRSTPRHMSVYQDISDALGLSVPAETLRDCSSEVFEALLAERPNPGTTAPDIGVWRPFHLSGRYILYMPSFNPYPVPKLLRMELRMKVPPFERATAELIVPRHGFEVRHRGTIDYADRLVLISLRSEEFEDAVIVTFSDPPTPVRAIAGLILGKPAYVANPGPHCTRTLLIRAPERGADPPIPDFYLDLDAAVMTRELAWIGLPVADHASLAVSALEFLGAPIERLTISVTNDAADHVMVAFERAFAGT